MPMHSFPFRELARWANSSVADHSANIHPYNSLILRLSPFDHLLNLHLLSPILTYSHHPPRSSAFRFIDSARCYPWNLTRGSSASLQLKDKDDDDTAHSLWMRDGSRWLTRLVTVLIHFLLSCFFLILVLSCSVLPSLVLSISIVNSTFVSLLLWFQELVVSSILRWTVRGW